ncbi:hypothetical protein JKP88DRAFT_254342 [Tribonema minus]|uniref:Uncharacterized protein n=1 Tax=Tribonema minus TaxID=303371 RepID=A0A835Z4Q2_9STRA|nr:hypothetical protein JKP88DRAFT_254342 [Tribonema minus]
MQTTGGRHREDPAAQPRKGSIRVRLGERDDGLADQPLVGRYEAAGLNPVRVIHPLFYRTLTLALKPRFRTPRRVLVWNKYWYANAKPTLAPHSYSSTRRVPTVQWCRIQHDDIKRDSEKVAALSSGSSAHLVVVDDPAAPRARFQSVASRAPPRRTHVRREGGGSEGHSGMGVRAEAATVSQCRDVNRFARRVTPRTHEAGKMTMS